MAQTRRVWGCVLALVATSGCGMSHGVNGLPDAGAPLDGCCAPRDGSPGPPDGAAPLDAFFTRASCAPMDASAIVCPASACDGLPTYFWNGGRCVPIGCGECDGAECGEGYLSQDACEDDHVACDASVCRVTGGDWLPALRYCGDFVCGVPSDLDCETPTPACNCGATGNFVPGVGCVASESCPAPDPTVDPERLCTSTGGAWENVCCPSSCGAPCAAECLAPACTCGVLQVWSDLLGCVDASRCMERTEGETCGDAAVCGEGTVCCPPCDAPGCGTAPTCVSPRCGAAGFDSCGNPIPTP